MTALIVINTIAALAVIGGLVAVTRLGHHAAGGRFDRALRRFALHHGSAPTRRTTERRAA